MQELKGFGFQNPYHEDHSIEMKKLGYQVIIGCGSNFSAMMPCAFKEADATPGFWQRLFREARPGYALIAVTKPCNCIERREWYKKLSLGGAI